MPSLRNFKFQFKKSSDQDLQIREYLKGIIGYSPRNFQLFKLAMMHSSVAKKNIKGQTESNERLEYLGDAILGAVIAEYLFKIYPYKDEGFLTEIRSRIVSRESLNQLGKKLGLQHIIEADLKFKSSRKSVYGDTLEALVGAVYLDRGYVYCRKFILFRLLEPFFNLKEIIKNNTNFKSRIIEWSQKESRELSFETSDVKDLKNRKEFTAEVLIDNKPIAVGYGSTKKKAEQDAAQKAIEQLNLDTL